MNKGASRDHGIQGAVSFSDHAPEVNCLGLTTLPPEQLRLLRRFVKERSVRKQVLCDWFPRDPSVCKRVACGMENGLRVGACGFP
jgi:hypothetical protein